MAYFELATIKLDINTTDTGIDAEINDWGAKADQKFNDLVFIYAQKKRRVTALPILPLTGTDITETVKNASNAFVKSYYYMFTKNPEMAREWREEGERLTTQYVENLRQDANFYGRIARS